MKNIHIENSYNVWNISQMRLSIQNNCYKQLNSYYPQVMLNRTYLSMLEDTFDL